VFHESAALQAGAPTDSAARKSQGERIMGRVLLGGILAGIIVFFWGFASHELLPVGAMGIRQIPDEDAVLDKLRGQIREAGLYAFPGHDMSKSLSDAEYRALSQKTEIGPTGMLIIYPGGRDSALPPRLVKEVATNILCALIAAIVLSQIKSGYIVRVLCVTLMGLFGFLIVSLPYWNWYGFPLDFTEGQGVVHVVGWFLAGLVMAAIVRPAKEKSAPVVA
jgi:hypothetical protein